MIKKLISLVFFATFVGCIEEVPLADLDINLGETYYVINGGLYSNRIEVRIQRTQPLENDQNINNGSNFISNATIELYEQTSLNSSPKLVSANITYKSTSKTYTNDNALATISGNYYWIKVSINDNIFQSKPEKMRNPISTQSYIIRIEDNTENDDSGEEPYAIRSFFKFNDEPNEKNYFVYRTVLYEYNTISSSYEIYDFKPEKIIKTVQDDLLEEDKNTRGLYVSDASLYYATTNSTLIPGTTIKRYQIRVVLWNVSFESYTYINKRLDESVNNERSSDENGFSLDQLFSAPPYNAFGNVSNPSTGEKTLGFFTVASETDSGKQNVTFELN